MRKLRTIDAAYEELKKMDPETSITKNYLKECVRGNKIPYISAGKKRLIDIEDLMDMIDRELKAGVAYD